MAQFKDAQARLWTITIDPIAIGDVIKETGVDCYKLIDDKCQPLAELLKNPPLFVAVVYVLCEEQCQRLGMSARDFGRMFTGDVLDAMGDCFVEALIDFFPQERGRAALKKLSEKGKQFQEVILETIETKIDQLDVAGTVQSWLAKPPASSPGPASASSDSVQVELPSVS